jgi:hypothetical protein
MINRRAAVASILNSLASKAENSKTVRIDLDETFSLELKRNSEILRFSGEEIWNMFHPDPSSVAVEESQRLQSKELSG